MQLSAKALGSLCSTISVLCLLYLLFLWSLGAPSQLLSSRSPLWLPTLGPNASNRDVWWGSPGQHPKVSPHTHAAGLCLQTPVGLYFLAPSGLCSVPAPHSCLTDRSQPSSERKCQSAGLIMPETCAIIIEGKKKPNSSCKTKLH